MAQIAMEDGSGVFTVVAELADNLAWGDTWRLNHLFSIPARENLHLIEDISKACCERLRGRLRCPETGEADEFYIHRVEIDEVCIRIFGERV